MKTHALALALAPPRCSRSAPATRATDGNGGAQAQTAEAAEGRRRQDDRRRASTQNSRFISRGQGRRPRSDARRAWPLHGARARRRRVRQGAGRNASTPSPRTAPQLTGVLTNLILPGTVLADDIDKAIDNGKGKAVLATMGGGTLTATKEGGKIVLTDAAGHKATDHPGRRAVFATASSTTSMRC